MVTVPDELPLPDPLTLSDAQQRGASCIWCTAPLANATAHDLGARPLNARGVSVLWFPRCCRICQKAQS